MTEYEDCPVCLEVKMKPEVVRQFPCNHEICQKCYVTHTARSIRCPFCRKPIQDTLHAKDELIQNIITNLADIERNLQKLQTCGFPRALKNEKDLKTRLEKVIKDMSNHGLYDQHNTQGHGYYSATSDRIPFFEDDLQTLFRWVGGMGIPGSESVYRFDQYYPRSQDQTRSTTTDNNGSNSGQQ